MKNERYFLSGIIRTMKPKKILEAGVANGGGSAIILSAIRDIDGAELYSVDYTENSYRYPDKPSGFLVDEKFPELKDKWRIFRGGDVSRYLEGISRIISRHYTPEQYKFFCGILELQKYIFAHPMTLKGSLKKSIKQRANPKLFTFLQKIKRSLRIK